LSEMTIAQANGQPSGAAPSSSVAEVLVAAMEDQGVDSVFGVPGEGHQLATTSGSMGYGLPAAVAAAMANPKRPVVCYAGDGCFMMTCQELATAVRCDLPIIIVVRSAAPPRKGRIRSLSVIIALAAARWVEWRRSFGGV
jgi:glyoxylate carboligase